MQAKLESTAPGSFRIVGPMTFETAVSLLKQSDMCFVTEKQIRIDFTQVPETDSAGLALLIEWKRAARAREREVKFENLPSQLVALARISEVDELLVDGQGPVEASGVL
jgi:phospholipid transport system transporter-binding protein